MNLGRYFSESRQELAKVIWPSRQDVIGGTQAVLVFLIALGILIFLYDFVFARLIALAVGT